MHSVSSLCQELKKPCERCGIKLCAECSGNFEYVFYRVRQSLISTRVCKDCYNNPNRNIFICSKCDQIKSGIYFTLDLKCFDSVLICESCSKIQPIAQLRDDFRMSH